MKKIICLMGPTASGKTKLAIELIQKLPCEIVSVDSAMVYKEMNIGTAKPTSDILAEAPHRLLDIRDPKDPYSAALFTEDVLKEINEIHAKDKIPLLVGGTMLYFHALQRGIAKLPAADADIRNQLNQEAKDLSWENLHRRLAEIDPESAARIHPNDSQRIQRALEVYMATGKSLTELQKENYFKAPFEMINIGIEPAQRSVLHERIADRFKDMLANGFVEEVELLFNRGDLSIDLPSIRSVGYRQIWQYLSGLTHATEMEEKGIIATRQLAKRQMTWLRHWGEVAMFDSEDENLLELVLKYIEPQLK